MAPEGGIVISDDTRALVEGYFELHTLGPTEVKGMRDPVNVYEVKGAGPLRSHFDLGDKAWTDKVRRTRRGARADAPRA